MALYNDRGELNLFGYVVTKNKSKDNETKSFVPAQDLNAGTEVVTSSGAAFNSYSIDLDPSSIKQEADLIAKYREISLIADVDQAIGEINDEILVIADTEPLIELDFVEEFAEKYSEKTKKMIIDEFKHILKLLKFNQVGPDITKNWYIDGRVAFHKVIDSAKPKDGIKELRPIDVIRLKKIVEVIKEKDPITNANMVISQKDYFIYSEQPTNQYASDGIAKQGLKIATESIAYVTSGLLDRNTGLVISYLHKAIRPMNQLRMMEDSDVIYRLTRAPARRVFYIDVQGMARTKAEQYIKDVMARYKNKQVFNVQTGSLVDDKKHLSILEDFFLPRNSAGKGTEIQQLDSGGTLQNLENTVYFQQKLWAALNIPLSRMQAGAGFNMGRSSEITRDEVKFTKFIAKLRLRFNILFQDILKTQLLLKGITTEEDWDAIKEYLVFQYSKDSFFAELKESDMLKERMNNAQEADQFVGKYFSKRFIQRKILKLSDEECTSMEEQMEKEAEEAAAVAQSQLQQGQPEQNNQPQ
jgi:hypothetical protein